MCSKSSSPSLERVHVCCQVCLVTLLKAKGTNKMKQTFCMKLDLIILFSLSTDFRAIACPNKSPCKAFYLHFHGTFHLCLSHPLWVTLSIPYFPSIPIFICICWFETWDTLATYSNSIRLVPPVPPGKEVLQRLLWKSKFNDSLCLCCKELHP